MQRTLTLVASLPIMLLLGACDDRAPESALYGTWQIEDGCIDCTHLVTLQPDHNVVGFSDSLGREWLDYRGRWYAGGQVLTIHYNNEEEAQSIVMRILDVAPQVIRVRWDGKELQLKRFSRKPPQASNQALQPTAQTAVFFYVQRSECADGCCHSRSPEPWLSLCLVRS